MSRKIHKIFLKISNKIWKMINYIPNNKMIKIYKKIKNFKIKTMK